MMANPVLESALRSLLMAGIVWIGLRTFRVRHVLAQKIAWTMVLAAAIAMPLCMRCLPAKEWSWSLPLNRLLPAVEAFPVRPAGSQPVARAEPAEIAPDGESFTAAPSNDADVLVPVAPDELTSTPARPSAPASRLARRLHSPAPWRETGEAVYGIVCGMLLLRLLMGLLSAHRIRSGAKPAPGLTGWGNIRVSPAVSSPITIADAIVLPASYRSWEATKLRAVLAHERSHVRQGDFYLQLLARFYTAITWFSPLGWYLQQILSDLGEAWSDRSALEEVADRAAYAEMLLDFAAIAVMPTVGVGMARASNLPRRIERLLNDAHFRSAFSRGRGRAWLAALFALFAMGAATLHPRVEAAQAVTNLAPQEASPSAAPTAAANSAPDSGPAAIAPAAPPALPQTASPEVRPEVEPDIKPGALPSAEAAPPAPPSPSAAPNAAPIPVPAPPDGGVPAPFPAPPSASELPEAQTPAASSPSIALEPFAIVDGSSGLVTGYGAFGDDFERVHNSEHGDYVWFKHDGKSYVIDDPEMVARARRLLQPQYAFNIKAQSLAAAQKAMADQLAHAGKIQMKIPNIDFDALNAKVQANLAEMQKDFAENQSLSPEARDRIQARLKDQLARLQAEQSRRQLESKKQLEINKETLEKMQETQREAFQKAQARISKELSDLAARKASAAQSARGQVQEFLDQAVRDGKARPVN